ncbi:Double-stranded RNA-binding protein [Sarracenia purpurea var. burkii]
MPPSTYLLLERQFTTAHTPSVGGCFVAEMYKNQLQELAQRRSCLNLPSYACTREGPDHAPRFRASVNFNGEIFDSPSYCTTLRQAEHAAAEVALTVLSARPPSRSLTSRVLDETGVYKNLLQETTHKAGLKLPLYTTVRSGPGHLPVFTSTVEIAGMNFTGESAKTKKQAEKNAAIAAWSSLKTMPNLSPLSQAGKETNKGESKQVRRDQNQGRRRMVRGQSQRDNASNRSEACQHWRSLDSASDAPTRKQNNILPLLTLPLSLPGTSSKILSPASSGDTPSLFSSPNRPTTSVQFFGETQGKIKEIPPPLVDEQPEHHRWDLEDEWFGGKSSNAIKNPQWDLEDRWHGGKSLDVIKNNPTRKEDSANSSLISGSDSIGNPISLISARKLSTSLSSLLDHEGTHIRSRLLGPGNPCPVALSLVTCSHMNRTKTIHPGEYNPQKIAPTVQIRSVIPVCAAPPLPMRPTPSMKEDAAASPSATSISTEASSSTSHKFDNRRLYSDPFRSMFDKKLQM